MIMFFLGLRDQIWGGLLIPQVRVWINQHPINHTTCSTAQTLTSVMTEEKKTEDI